MKKIITAVAILLTVGAFAFMMKLDKEAERFKQIEEIIEKTKMEVSLNKNVKITKIEEPTPTPRPEEKKDNEAEEKLNALKKRAGNAMAFKVSPLYKQKCSSCHGVNGEGIIGPKLIGLTKEQVLKALEDFKSGTRKNYVMYGLLSKMSQEDIEKLSEEIGTFAQKAQENN
jgi:cytochrome c553